VENAELRDRIILTESGRDRMRERFEELESTMKEKFASLEGVDKNQIDLEQLKKSFYEKYSSLKDEHKRSEDEQRQHETQVSSLCGSVGKDFDIMRVVFSSNPD